MVRWRSGCGFAVALALLGLQACGGGDGGEFGRLEIPAPPAQVTASGFDGPFGLTFDSAGYLYVGSVSGHITRIAPDGRREVWVETGHSLAGLTTGPQDEIFAAAPNAGQVLAISQGRSIRVATSGLDTPTAIVFDRNDRALVSARGVVRGDAQIAVIEFDTTFRTLTKDILSPTGMAFAPNGRLYVADTERNRVVELEIDGFGEARNLRVAASGIELPTGIAFDKRGDMFVTGGNRIWTVRPSGAVLEAYVVGGALDYPASLAFGFGDGRDRKQMFFTNYGFPLGSGTTVAHTWVGIEGQDLFAP